MIDKIKRRIKDYISKFLIELRIPYEYIGSDYGGWVISPTNIDESTIIYSFGVGGDISFELAVIEKYRCQIFAFDPTPKAISFIKKTDHPKEFKFFEYGIADFDGDEKFYPPKNPQNVSFSVTNSNTRDQNFIYCPVKKLSSIMKDLGHKKIDVLKMDVEGAEYTVLENIINEDIQINQLLVEFHNKWKSIGKAKTKSSIKLLQSGGYKIFYVSPKLAEFSFFRNN